MKETRTTEFRVLSLNTWMLRLPFGLDLAKEVDERFSRLPQLLAESQADIILLQEMWCPVQRRVLANKMAELGYPYSVTSGSSGRKPLHSTAVTSMLTFKAIASVLGASCFSGSGNHDLALALSGFALAGATVSTLAVDTIRSWMSNGLQIISRYPTSPNKNTFSFTQHTRPDEFFIRKGVLHTQVHVPSLGWIDIYDTHLGAVTFDASQARYDSWETEMRSEQMKELLAFTSQRSSPLGSVIAGDFNIRHTEEEREAGRAGRSKDYLSIEAAGLIDTYRQVKGFEDPFENTDDSNNHFKRSGPFRDTPNGVLDYICYDSKSTFACTNSKTVFVENPISDHYGVLSTFSFKTNLEDKNKKLTQG